MLLHRQGVWHGCWLSTNWQLQDNPASALCPVEGRLPVVYAACFVGKREEHLV